MKGRLSLAPAALIRKIRARQFSQDIQLSLQDTSHITVAEGVRMDRIAGHSTPDAKLAPVSAGHYFIRPEILEAFREGGLRHEGERKRQTYQDAFDRLIGVFGRSPKMAVVSWCIASNLAQLIGDQSPKGWRRTGVTYGDPSLEKAVREFQKFERHFFSLARKFLPVAKQMRDCQPVYDAGLDALVKAIQPFASLRARAADSRSEWHSSAQLFAERIETHFQSANLKPPTRNSAHGPLVLAVQSLLEMVGQRVETDAIRKVLRQPRSSRHVACGRRPGAPSP